MEKRDGKIITIINKLFSKMKNSKMYQFIAACFISLMCLGFTACGGEDSYSTDTNSNSPNGQVNQEENSYNLQISTSFSQAQVTANVPGLYNFYYSKTENGPYTKYSYLDDSKVVQTLCNNQFVVYGLTPGTNYYCYIVYEQKKSKVISFKTKDFDLSRVESSAVKRSIINSYIDRYGNKKDLSWLGKKYTISITSNLGNSYKYGVFAIKGVDEETLVRYINSPFEKDYIHYSTSTSNPYVVSVNNYPNTNNLWIDVAYDNIEFLVELANSGDATSDDYDELEALLGAVQMDTKGISDDVYIRAFVEINDERIYFGKYWK
jgi:hypothetical protein